MEIKHGDHWVVLKYPGGAIDLLDSNLAPMASYGRSQTSKEWTYRGGTEEQIAKQMALVDDYMDSQMRSVMAS